MRKPLFLVGFCLMASVIALVGSQAEQPIPTGTAATNWVSVGPEGGNIKGLAFHPSNPSQITALISGYPSSIYRTTNGGQSWARIAVINENLTDIDYDPLNGNVLYAPSSYHLWKSANGGGSWSSFSFPSSSYCTGALAVHPTSPNILYGCGYSYSGSNCFISFLKSTDSGANWTAKTVSPVGEYALSYVLAVSPANPNLVYMSGYYYSGSAYNKLYKSADGGATWQDVTGTIGTGYQILGLAVDPTNANKVYAATAWGIFRSSDAGGSWTKNSGYAYGYALAIDKTNPNTLYAGYNKEVYKSTDGGVNWTKSTGMFGTCSVVLVSTTNLYFGSNAGVYRSLNAGSSWQEANSGMKASNIVAVTASLASPNIVYSEMTGSGFYRSTNFGMSWSRCPDFYRCESITRILTGTSNGNEVFILAGG